MLTERKMKTLSPYRNIVQIETYNVQAGQKIASCDFKIENLNVDHNQGSLNLTRLESSVWLTYEDASWKIVDYTHRYRFYDRKKGEMVDMKFREDQFAHFNGRDWIDNSAEYRKRMKNELGRK
jgi:hypothetical protein